MFLIGKLSFLILLLDQIGVCSGNKAQYNVGSVKNVKLLTKAANKIETWVKLTFDHTVPCSEQKQKSFSVMPLCPDFCQT